MVVIVNYDLYIRINGSWQLHGRYSSDQKNKVFLDAKGVEENQYYPVKIIKENFNADTADSSESVVYMSKNTFDSKKDEIKREKAAKAKRKKQIKKNKEAKKAQNAQNITTKRSEKKARKGNDEFLTVGVKLLILIIASILIAKAVLWVIDPALEIIFKGDDLYNAKFFAFFIIFLGFAIPLILRNITWNVSAREKIVLVKNKRRNTTPIPLSENDLDDGIATPFEAVPIDYTKQSIAVLDKFVSAVKDIKAPINQFTKFGIKLAIYGACKHLKEKEELSQAQMNTLLHDSFGILDTDTVDGVAEFFESKATYENIDLAKTMVRAGENVVANIHEYNQREFDHIATIMKSWQNVAEKANIPSQNQEKEQNQDQTKEQVKASPLYADSEDITTEAQDESFSDDDDYQGSENINDEDGDFEYDLSNFMEDNSPHKQEEKKDNEVVTVLFSDIVNSTVLNEQYGDDIAFELLEKHNKIYRNTLSMFGGREIKHTGDGIMSSFNSVNKAAEASIEMQKEFFKYNQQKSTNPKLDVRIGLNTGEPVKSNNDLFGSTVQVASRCCDMAEGGEILATSVVKGLLTGKSIKLQSIGEKKLKGLSEPIGLYKILFTPGFAIDENNSDQNNNDTDEDLIKAGVF